MKTPTRLTDRMPQVYQHRATRSLGDKYIAAYRKIHSWRKVARQFKVFLDNGEPNGNLVFVIAMRDFEPIMPETRARLGLPPLNYCPTCKRRMVKHQHAPKQNWRSLMDIDLSRLAWMFENRETIS